MNHDEIEGLNTPHPDSNPKQYFGTINFSARMSKNPCTFHNFGFPGNKLIRRSQVGTETRRLSAYNGEKVDDVRSGTPLWSA
jgi:hypothetical protein